MNNSSPFHQPQSKYSPRTVTPRSRIDSQQSVTNSSLKTLRIKEGLPPCPRSFGVPLTVKKSLQVYDLKKKQSNQKNECKKMKRSKSDLGNISNNLVAQNQGEMITERRDVINDLQIFDCDENRKVYQQNGAFEKKFKEIYSKISGENLHHNNSYQVSCSTRPLHTENILVRLKTEQMEEMSREIAESRISKERAEGRAIELEIELRKCKKQEYIAEQLKIKEMMLEDREMKFSIREKEAEYIIEDLKKQVKEVVVSSKKLEEMKREVENEINRARQIREEEEILKFDLQKIKNENEQQYQEILMKEKQLQAMIRELEERERKLIDRENLIARQMAEYNQKEIDLANEKQRMSELVLRLGDHHQVLEQQWIASEKTQENMQLAQNKLLNQLSAHEDIDLREQKVQMHEDIFQKQLDRSIQLTFKKINKANKSEKQQIPLSNRIAQSFEECSMSSANNQIEIFENSKLSHCSISQLNKSQDISQSKLSQNEHENKSQMLKDQKSIDRPISLQDYNNLKSKTTLSSRQSQQNFQRCHSLNQCESNISKNNTSNNQRANKDNLLPFPKSNNMQRKENIDQEINPFKSNNNNSNSPLLKSKQLFPKSQLKLNQNSSAKNENDHSTIFKSQQDCQIQLYSSLFVLDSYSQPLQSQQKIREGQNQNPSFPLTDKNDNLQRNSLNMKKLYIGEETQENPNNKYFEVDKYQTFSQMNELKTQNVNQNLSLPNLDLKKCDQNMPQEITQDDNLLSNRDNYFCYFNSPDFQVQDQYSQISQNKNVEQNEQS